MVANQGLEVFWLDIKTNISLGGKLQKGGSSADFFKIYSRYKPLLYEYSDSGYQNKPPKGRL